MKKVKVKRERENEKKERQLDKKTLNATDRQRQAENDRENDIHK